MNSNATAPSVGTRAFYSVGSDRYPCTVVAVSPSGHRVTVREVKITKCAEDPSGYGLAFEETEKGEVVTFTRRADGRYRRAGWDCGGLLSCNGWASYSDPSF